MFLDEFKVKPKKTVLQKIKDAFVYAVLSEVPPCESYSSWTDYGYEYDCGYQCEVECGNCICAGGNIDPRTDKKFKKVRRYFR